MDPPVAIPGYTWDPIKRRYFKALPGASSSSSSSHPSPPGPSAQPPSSQHGDRKGKRKASQSDGRLSGSGEAVDAVERRMLPRRSRKERGFVVSSVSDPPPLRLAEANRLERRFEQSTFTTPRGFRSVFPSVLPLGEEITTLHAIPPSSSSASWGLRIGGSRGSIARGYLPGDEEVIDEEMEEFLGFTAEEAESWRMEWAMNSSVTSLGQCGTRTIATCLGPPAQAIISLSSSTLSTASITLSPRKTDLWSSSLSPTSLALGCDGNVLVAEVADLAGRGEGGEGRVSGGMTPYVTKSAVYAVEQSINTIYAGTRGGKVLMFDRRSSRPQYRFNDGGGGPKPPRGILSRDGAVTHLKLLNGDRQMLIGGTSDYLALHDLRFLSSRSSPFPSPTPAPPLLSFPSHRNAYLRTLGLSVLPSLQLLFAAGQDRRVRAWSLLDGQEVEGLKLGGGGGRGGRGGREEFEEPVKAVAAFDDWPAIEGKEPEVGMDRRPRGKTPKGPCLVVADGAMLQCTSVFP